ncbi:gamma-interferon-responsive lysosomal thiol protein isoform X3 [Gossypium raimondii]|uniref:gamma-interferon-responsive lysosomal thiol protein isoform X3 n=1 Tax=Gossypium raimondii TaxID=29730 RepID=UPI00227C4F88|nr:gamma-interferon-responsive lysosomal thiol protein isoform X3 [Gossypium raimondii]
MAYLQPLIFYILSALAIFWLISPSHSSLDNVNDKVTVSLYYETSLCPRCASFISNDLVKVFHTDLHTIINLRLVPWSNAEIHCQHGEEECHLNTIHSCVIHFWPDKEHLEFIGCTEQQSLKGWPVEALWKNCSEKLRLNEVIINQCYTTGFGYKLLLQYANETAHLKPPQEYVPWVVVNNQPLRQDFENFVKYVCQAYKGDHKPAACKAQSSNLSPTIYASFAVPQPPVIPVVDFYKLALQWPPLFAALLSTVNSQSQLNSKYMEFGRKTLMTCRCPHTMQGSLAPIHNLF